MPRFVLLRHKCPAEFDKPSHWDFMLEFAGVLRTWELRELPAAWAEVLGDNSEKQTVAAIRLPDHRLAYLDYEGPLSEKRGSVSQCDCGTYEVVQEDDSGFTILLEGRLLAGTILMSEENGHCSLQVI